MDLGSRRGGVTGPSLQSMGLRKMRHLVHVVGFACWEVLALGHGARGSERQVQMVSTKQYSAIDYNRHGGWMEVSSLIERKSEIGLHVIRECNYASGLANDSCHCEYRHQEF